MPAPAASAAVSASVGEMSRVYRWTDHTTTPTTTARSALTTTARAVAARSHRLTRRDNNTVPAIAATHHPMAIAVPSSRNASVPCAFVTRVPTTPTRSNVAN